MSSTNVFGKPITAAEYPEREARASAAYGQIDADEKKTQVKDYVRKLKESYGDGVSVLAMVYNATGESIHFSTSKDWYGKLYTDGGSSYPKIIQNGQWGGFLHIKSPVVATGSEAAVVYRAKPNAAGDGADVVVAWDDSWAPGSNNRVYTEIGGGEVCGFGVGRDKEEDRFEVGFGEQLRDGALLHRFHCAGQLPLL
ncbi:hypothetical protein DM860_013714 [Cuscuta australis]|uniref:Uncharacterized protein n=1 Tax=Cuscuta australis TaxID=267555 RepID=A0A328EE98_9ASTE|nr:hypothetical protein DM860_013714 [Cuscuta australis]